MFDVTEHHGKVVGTQAIELYTQTLKVFVLGDLHPPNNVNFRRAGNVVAETPLQPPSGAKTYRDEVILGKVYDVRIGQVQNQLIRGEGAHAFKGLEVIKDVRYILGVSELGGQFPHEDLEECKVIHEILREPKFGCWLLICSRVDGDALVVQVTKDPLVIGTLVGLPGEGLNVFAQRLVRPDAGVRAEEQDAERDFFASLWTLFDDFRDDILANAVQHPKGVAKFVAFKDGILGPAIVMKVSDTTGTYSGYSIHTEEGDLRGAFRRWHASPLPTSKRCRTLG